MSYMIEETALKILDTHACELSEQLSQLTSDEEKKARRLIDAMYIAAHHTREELKRRKGEAIIIDGGVWHPDLGQRALELARTPDVFCVDFRCPVCGALTNGIHLDILKEGIFCWACGQAVKTSHGRIKMIQKMRQKSWHDAVSKEKPDDKTVY